MTGQELREARKKLGWTQQQAAGRLGVSQPYLSLMEHGVRSVPPRLVNRLVKYNAVTATALPLESRRGFDPQPFAASLAALGYPRFSHLAHAARAENPAALLLSALQQQHLEPRLTEALPWLLVHYSNLNWHWLVDQVKQFNLQNRLGFLVSVAKALAERQQATEVATTLARWEATLEEARLAKVDALGRTLTAAERQYFQVHRSEVARHWNLLTGLSADMLQYA